jgi:rSAM/selenodomain-associated transferase 2
MSQIITILPALNAAAHLERTLQSLTEAERAGLSAGWVLAYGGSTDGTVQIARRAGCQIVTGAKGRGAQLAQGAALARRQIGASDWLLFLHADTRLSPGWSAEVETFMATNAHRDRAAYFHFTLDDMSHRARRLERAVAWRCKTFGLPYGDQGLLIRADFYDRLGGYKPWPLFEDVDLVRRIGKHRLWPLTARAETSAEKFRAEGYRRRSLKNLVLLARYYLGAKPSDLAKAYR